jgi:hypothetical protein
MSFSSGPSLDMPTISDPLSATTFVKAPEVQEISQNRNIPKSMNTAPQNDQIKDIQNILKDDDIEYLTNNKYKGESDGVINDELKQVAQSLELTIYKLTNKNINGLLLKTNANDIKNTVKLLIAYKNNFETKQHKISQDQRIYELGKIKMIKK